MDGIPTLSASYAMGGRGGTGQKAADVTVTNNGKETREVVAPVLG